MAHPIAKQIAQYVRFIGAAYCQGRLYDLGNYPGLCLTAQGDDIVHGEAYQLISAAKVLRILDDYEGCTALHRRPHEYRRVQHTITLQNGDRLKAWVYIYQGKPQPHQRIESGDYESHIQHQAKR